MNERTLIDYTTHRMLQAEEEEHYIDAVWWADQRDRALRSGPPLTGEHSEGNI